MVEAKSIPDKMDTPDEIAAAFWKVWEKPWFKKYQQKESSISENVDEYFEKRNEAMEQAMLFQEMTSFKPAAAPAEKTEDTAKRVEQKEPPALTKPPKETQKPSKQATPTPKIIEWPKEAAPKQEIRQSQSTLPAEKPAEQSALTAAKPAQSSVSSPLRVRPA